MPLRLENRWAVLALLSFSRMAMGLAFGAVPALLPMLVADLSLSYTQSGWLIGVFMLVGAPLALPSGIMGAWLGDRGGLLLGFCFMSAGGAALALSGGFGTALGARLCAGVGAVLVNVVATKVITDWFTGREIATAMGLLGITWPGGIALALSVLPTLAQAADWRWAVWAVVLVTALSLLLIGACTISAPGAATGPAQGRRLWHLGRREAWLMVVGGLPWPLMNGAYLIFSSYLPGYLVAAGATVVVGALITSVGSWLLLPAVPLGGLLSDRWGWRNTQYVIGTLGAAAAMALLLGGGPPLPLMAAYAVLLALAVGPVMALPSEVLAPESRMTGMAVFLSVFYLGMGTLPALGGYAQDVAGGPAAAIWFGIACTVASPAALGVFRWMQARWRVTAPAA